MNVAIDSSEVVSTLNNLIQVCRDGEVGYRDAAKDIQNSGLKVLFEQFEMQRTRFIAELQTHVEQMSSKEAQDGGSLVGALHRGWINLRAALTAGDEPAILAECERGEDVAVEAYEKGLQKSLPASVATLVGNQYREVKAAHDKIKSLCDAYKNEVK